jgi:hypothetical protein
MEHDPFEKFRKRDLKLLLCDDKGYGLYHKRPPKAHM